jgi:uncharacterized membrane-anchored protein YjiN (DUF445 family)
VIGANDPRGARAGLARARRNATGLLAAVAVLFVATAWLPDSVSVGYLRAALEAGLVGGLADWFAVVALFRHPMGIPIPHTAVIAKSKDGLGRNLASFVEDNLLAGPQVRERIGDPAHIERLARWIASDVQADKIVAKGAVVLDAMLDAVDEQAMRARVVTVARARLRELPVARLTGQVVGDAVEQQRHAVLVTAALEGIVDTMVKNRSALRTRLGQQSPSWVPPVLDDLVFERGEHVVRTFLDQIASDPEHELRHALDEQLLALTARLRTDAATQDRVDDNVQEAVSDELLGEWITGWWADARRLVRGAAIDDAAGRELRHTAVQAVTGIAERLLSDEDLRARAEGLIASAAEPIAALAQREVGAMIAATVDRWDAAETSSRLEDWLGRDLQFVRINGTLVGALVGVFLHALSGVLG